MSLTHCPECAHEVSLNAVACPNCGRPVHAPPVVERKIVVAPPEREGGFPTWALIPIGLLGVILLFVAYLAFRGTDDQANTNINVNVAGRRTTTATTDPVRDSRTTTVPSSDAPAVSVPGQTTTVPGSTTSVPVAPAPDKGTVVINARIAPSSGSAQTAKNTKFYLLDDDLESILSEARVEPIEGNSLTASLGLAAVFPDRYGEFQRAAERAIARHVKYSGTTSSSGSANLSGIEPKQYHLFGITRVGKGFALWNAPVSIIAGENVLNLSPQSVTPVRDSDS